MLPVMLVSEDMFCENTFFLTDEESKEALLVDPGNCFNKIKNFISKNRLKPTAILLTHGHLDHIWCASELIAEYGIPLYANKKEEAVINAVNLSTKMFGLKELVPPRIDHYLEAGELKLGSQVVQVISTPGHTQGGVSFLWKNYLLSGDTLFYRSIGRTDLPGGDHKALIQSIKERLFSLPEDTVVYPGHGIKTTINEEKKFNPFLSS